MRLLANSPEMNMTDQVETQNNTPEASVENAASIGAPTKSSIPLDELARLSDDIVSAIKTVYDPEIPADIYELGLTLQDRYRR